MRIRLRLSAQPGSEVVKAVWLIAVVVLTTAPSRAATPVAADTESAVLAVEHARTQALDRSDVAALRKIMADDVTYVHASGRVDSKTSYLAAIRSGQLHYISWQADRLRVRMVGNNAAVLTGEYAVRVTDARVQPQPFDVDILILSVYELRNGQWQQIAWQSTRKP